jgi:hypothetical protein
MEPKTKKGLLIGCGIAAVLLLCCCILSIVLGKMYGGKGIRKMVSYSMSQALPQGTDQQKIDRLVELIWDDITSQHTPADEAAVQDFQNNLNAAMADQELSPEEFDQLLDDLNSMIYDSNLDSQQMEQIKASYQSALEDEEFSGGEANQVLSELIQLLEQYQAAEE